MLSILEHDHFKVLFHIKAILYDPKNDFKTRDVTPKMLFILGCVIVHTIDVIPIFFCKTAIFP